MKKMLLIAFVVIAIQTIAQPAEVSRDEKNGSKVLKGFITKKDLTTDTAFGWFAENQKGYTPEQNALQTFRANKDSINIIAFVGTWCSDTKNILPKFFLLTDAAGFPEDRITMLGVDRNKKTIQHLSEAFNIINVPTFIVMKNGKEVGRVVEYGKYGMVDKELGQIIATPNK
ncbi:MAG: thioredoxin family protein [Chitinophagaceae bacterium]|nr:thioredoxin family protein [Chitinophagaceae bacterium]